MTVRRVVADLETRSPVDLKARGAHVYGEDPLTRILCLALCDADNPARREMWIARAVADPGDPLHGVPLAASQGLPFPVYYDGDVPPLVREIERGAEPVAHNAPFEIANWPILVRRYGFPEIDPLRWICTMARAALSGVPGRLELACPALNLRHRKNMDGHRAMLRLCKPRAARKGEDPERIYWHDDAADHRANYLYAMDDAIAEAEVLRALPEPPPQEVALMRVDRKINALGIGIDIEAAVGAQEIAAKESKRLDREMKRLTNGMISTVGQRDKILSWCALQGFPLDDLRANTLRDALADEDAPDDFDVIDGALGGAMGEMPEHVRAVLSVRAEAAKASAKKIKAMVRRASADGRVRGGLAYRAAYRTGRFAGRGIQPHNDPRENPPYTVPEEVWFDALASGDRDYFASFLPGPTETKPGWTVMDGLKASIRGLKLPAPGKVYVTPDLAQIEARAIGWAAGQNDKVAVFQRYDATVKRFGKESAEAKAVDLYTIAGQKMQMGRQAGKVSELSCGYGAGGPTLQAFAAGYGMKLSTEDAVTIVNAWRKANPMIVLLWKAEEDAAKEAIENPDRIVCRGKLGAYKFDSRSGNLLRQLPCRYRFLVYRRARIEMMPTPWGQNRRTITYDGNIFAKHSDSFVRLKTYGGKLVENLIQAMCCDILCEALVEMDDDYSLPVPFHVHDEAIGEVIEDRAEEAARIMEACMTRPREWAPGLPIASSAEIVRRYRKS